MHTPLAAALATVACLASADNQTTLVSADAQGVIGDSASSLRPAQQDTDGRYVVFTSSATNLVPGDTNGLIDVFVKDTQTGAVVRASTSSTGVQSNGESSLGMIDAAGRYVAFQSSATNLGSSLTVRSRIYLKDLSTGMLKLVSTSSSGVEANSDAHVAFVFGGGRYVAFQSNATNLTSDTTNGNNNVYIKDLQTGQTVLASKTAAGTVGNGSSLVSMVSADGRYLAFQSNATNFGGGAIQGVSEVWRKDLSTGDLLLVSCSADGISSNGDSLLRSVSGDGRYVAFYSFSNNLVSGDTNQTGDVFLKDCQTGEVHLISVGADGLPANGYSGQPTVSQDGRYVLFESDASNLTLSDTNNTTDIFVRDWQARMTWRVSVALDGSDPNGRSYFPSISPDGHTLFFTSDATNLVSGDTNVAGDVFQRPNLLETISASKLTVSPGAAYIGKIVYLTGTLKDRKTLAPLPNEMVTISLDGDGVGTTLTDETGKAIVAYLVLESMPLGSHTLRATYLGDAAYLEAAASRTLDVKPGPVRITVPKKSTTVNTAVTLSARLVNGYGFPLAGRTLKFLVDGVSFGTSTTNAKGIATKTYTPTAVGSFTVKATFAGDATHNAGSGSGTLTVQ